MEDKLVTIAEFDTPFEAELAKVRLENEGIEAMIVGEDLVANMPTIPAMRVELQVFEKDVEQAEAVLAAQIDDEDLDAEDEEEEESWEEPDENAEDDFDFEDDEPE